VTVTVTVTVAVAVTMTVTVTVMLEGHRGGAAQNESRDPHD